MLGLKHYADEVREKAKMYEVKIDKLIKLLEDTNKLLREQNDLLKEKK